MIAVRRSEVTGAHDEIPVTTNSEFKNLPCEHRPPVTEPASPRPRLCFVGAMVGRNPGHVTQQGQVLADLFTQTGCAVMSVSAFLNRYRRLADIVTTLIRQRRQIDIVILEVYSGRSFVVADAASWLASRFGLRIVMWLHGGALGKFMDRFPRWTRRVLGRADLLVTPSEFLTRATSKRGFRARVVPNVIDLPNYPHRHRQAVRPRLFWMRSFHPTWNPIMAVRVLDQLRFDFPDATLVMAGADKGIQSEVEDFARNLGLSDHVRFPGFLDLEAKVREGEAADIYINTNRIDNTPIAVLEACAMGLPVVSTNVGGIPDLLTHGHTALLVQDDNAQAMAQAVKHLIDNPDLAQSLSRNGRQLAQRFSWELVRPQWEQMFSDLMMARPTQSTARWSA
jgi:glycosyltransferase involved in cell wall biosynthesis